MSAPRYYRTDVTRLVWGAVIALALAVALWFAGRATARAIRADERAAVLREGDVLLQLALARGDTLRRVADSLRLELGRVDTVLVERIRRVRDTAWLPADTAPRVRLAACRATLDTLADACARFRAATALALAAADSVKRHDSSAFAGMAGQLAAVRRADSLKAEQLAGRGRRRSFAAGVCAASVAGNFLQWRAR